MGILGPSLFEKIYGRGGLRQKATHGKLRDDIDTAHTVMDVYKQVVLGHLKDTLDLASLKPIATAPRAHAISSWLYFLQLPSGFTPSLEKIDTGNAASGGTPEFPKGTYMVDTPASY